MALLGIISFPKNIVAVLTLVLGILVLLFPRLLRWILGLYLIIIGLLGLIS
jgi:hypothetical protein